MAVIYCPDCKKEMSDTASICPNCGYPYAQKKALYLKALKFMQGCTTSDGFVGVAELFHSMPEFQDAETLEKQCRVKAGMYYEQEVEQTRWKEQERIRQQEELKRKHEEQLERARIRQEQERIRREEKEKQRGEQKKKRKEFFKRNKKYLVIGVILLLMASGILVTGRIIIPNLKFRVLQSSGQYETLSAGSSHTVGLKNDGTVIVTGNNPDVQCDVSDWSNIVAVSFDNHVIGLKNNGRVIVDYGWNEMSDWRNIISIDGNGRDFSERSYLYRSDGTDNSSHTVGLKSDGTVVAAGDNWYGQCDVSDWTDIVAISAGGSHTVGLKSDGTVIATGNNISHQCDVSDWTDIVAISAGDRHTVGLKSDGTVIAVGVNVNGRCDVSDWTDIVAISAGGNHTVGLKSDGTVIATGDNWYGQCDVSDWTDIVAISAGRNHTVGLKSDGTVIAVGNNEDGQCDVSNWTDIKIPR